MKEMVGNVSVYRFTLHSRTLDFPAFQHDLWVDTLWCLECGHGVG